MHLTQIWRIDMKEDLLKKVTEDEDFDFEAFKKEVITGLKEGC